MRLTSLTINGFKSFGDRVTLEFASGVTAVVGPNGSGKSNVIDALRWASGGGRASEFRAGDKTELIFHGAAGKKSLSYAEVQLELLGGRRRIHISRSLYRDGQSKLRLNGKNASFLDLEEELAGSGLGKSGLALIGQGEVSQVLMADPAKLLSYVAEAAGVSKFAARREQTQSRLEATREHLARLEDIIRELRRQLEQLQGEAAEAERASMLSREVLQLKYSLSLRRVQSLQTEIDNLQDTRRDLQTAVEAGRGELEEAQRGWREGRDALAALEEAYRKALAAAEARRGDLRVAQERFKNAVARREAQEKERRNLEAELARLEASAPPEAPEGDEVELEQAGAEAKAKREAAQQALSQAEAGLQTLSVRLESLRLEHGRAQNALLDYEHRRQELEEGLEAVRVRLRELEAEGVLDVTEQDAKRKALQEALEAKREEVDRLRDTLTELHQQQANAVAEAQALGRAAARSRSAFEARQGYAQGPRLALTSGIEGVIGSVADLVRVPPEYELAIGSALGRRTENVVVDSAATAQKVLAHLKRGGGWATLLPLDLVKARPPRLDPQLAGAPGVIGLASELVDFDARFTGIIHQLLGGTLLLGDMEQAVALARSFRQRPRLVTLEGDLLESYGAMSGGRRQVNTGLLGLAGEVEEAEQAAQRATQAAERRSEDLKAKQAAFHRLQAAVEPLAADLKRVETALGQARERAAAKSSLQEELRNRQRELAARLSQLVKPEIPEDESKLAELESLREDAQGELLSLRAKAAEAVEGEAEARQRMAVFRERRESYLQALRRFEEEQRRLASLHERRQGLTEALEAGRQEAAQAEAAVAEAAAALPQDLGRKEKAFEEGKAQSSQAETMLAALTQAQAERGAKLEELQLTLARREAALEHGKEELSGFPAGLEPVEDGAGSLKVLRDRLSEAESELGRLGPVNHRAWQEAEAQQLRLDELEVQSTEAGLAAHELESVLHDIDQETNTRLAAAITRLRGAFVQHVRQLFGPDAQAAIEVAYEEDRPNGLSIRLQPPGKQTRSLNLLSVGERTMGALAFLFALMSETEGAEGPGGGSQRLPIAILDEVDAPLDEANIRRFRDFLQRLARQGTQFILITHQKATMEVADALWGVTTERGVSRVFSINRTEGAVVG